MKNRSYKNKFRRWQWRVLLGFGLLYFFYYAGRQNIALAIPLLKKEFGWTEAQLGFISACLFWTYGFSHLLWGRLSDKIGGRLPAATGGLLSLVANWLCSFARTVGGLAFPWAINGFVQAMGWSPGTRLVANWWPSRQRGFAMGVLLSSCGWATVMIWLLGGWVGVHWGWRGIFRIPPLFLGAMSLVYFFTVRNYPHEVGLKDYVEEEKKEWEKITGIKPYFNVLKNWKFDLACLAVGTAHLTRYFFLTWIPLYYSEALGFSIMKVAALSLVLPLGMGIGPVVSGWISDKFFGAKRYQIASSLLVATTVCTIVVGFIPPANLLLGGIFLFLVGLCIFGGEGPIWALCADLAGKNQTGTAAGIMEWVAYMFAALQAVVLGAILTLTGGNWKLLFVLVAIIQLIGVRAIWAVKR